MTNASVNAFLDSTNEYESIEYFSDLTDQSYFALIKRRMSIVVVVKVVV